MTDTTFLTPNGKFNYRVGAVIVNNNRLLVLKDERSPYYYLPGGRVHFGERAEDAILRELKEELKVDGKIVRPLWLCQNFFNEDVTKVDFHELCLYFLVDVGDISYRGDTFVLQDDKHTLTFSWLSFESLTSAYLYPSFIKKEAGSLPQQFLLRTDFD